MADEISYPVSPPPKPGELSLVAPGIWWLRMPLPFALNHINLWLLEDGDGWTLVDTGLGDSGTRDLWLENLETWLGGRPITRILVTHFHPDHLGQAVFLAAHFQAPILMTAGEWNTAREICAASDETVGGARKALFMRHGLDAARAEELRQRGNSYLRMVPSAPQAVDLITEGSELMIGGRRWRVIIGRGHAPEHACLYCADSDLLISGDQVLPRITTNVSVGTEDPEADPLEGFLSTIERLAALPAATRVLPSHGYVFDGLHARLEQLRVHHAEQLGLVEEACRQAPKSAADILPVLFGRRLNSHTVGFAMGEAIAHLNYLYLRKRLSRYEADGVLTFTAEAAHG